MNPLRSEYSFALDWDNLVRLAEEPGRFICDERPLLYYRVHEGATTKACIRDNRRFAEEREMFCRFWPEPVADGHIMGFIRRLTESMSSSFRTGKLVRIRKRKMQG